MISKNIKPIKLKYKNKIYAYVMHKEIFSGKYNFINKPSDILQLGFFQLNNRDVSKCHYHNFHKRISKKTSEFIYVVSGSIRINFYSKNGTLLDSFKLGKGASILIFDLAHEIEYLKKTKLIEVKTGPFVVGDKTLVL